MTYYSPSEILVILQGTTSAGLYYIRAKTKDVIRNLSEELQNEFVARLSKYPDSPDSMVIYIGKASGADGLFQRLQQDLLHRNPASFFRGVGAVMGKHPLRATAPSCVKNYRFCADDTNEIISFIEDNFEVAAEENSIDNLLALEKDLIKKYQPIFNIVHNPHPSFVIKKHRARCRVYAGEFIH